MPTAAPGANAPTPLDVLAEYMPVDDLAARLGVSPSTIYRQLARAQLPVHAVKIGRQWRIRRADVELWLAPA